MECWKHASSCPSQVSAVWWWADVCSSLHRYAEKYAKRVLSKMNKRNFVSMGMRSIIMECHMGKDDTMVYSL